MLLFDATRIHILLYVLTAHVGAHMDMDMDMDMEHGHGHGQRHEDD